MAEISLPETLARMADQGASDSPAYNILFQDYVDFHFVMVVGGAVCLCAILAMTGLASKKISASARGLQGPLTNFERRTYWLFGLAGTVTSLIMLLIVVGNLSTVLAPQDGFVHTFPDMRVAPSDVRRVALHEEVKLWLESDDPQIPSLFQRAVRDRLSWQQPKAVICGLLFLMLLVPTALLWNSLIRHSRLHNSMAKPKWVCLTILGIFALPIDFLLMLMALANTQASFAPLTLTLLSG